MQKLLEEIKKIDLNILNNKKKKQHQNNKKKYK